MIGFDLLTASIGLAASALTAALLLPLWRRSPVPAYRLTVSVLAAALALPLLQAGARALDLPLPHPVRDLARSLVGSTPESPAQPAAEPLELVLAPDEANGFVLDEALLASLDTASLPERPAPVAAAGPPSPTRLSWASVLLALWAAGALWALARTLLRLRATRLLFAAATPIEDPAVLAIWDGVRAGSRIGDRAQLLQSSEVRTPACSGLLHPSVVLPADSGLELRPELLGCVLTHELVHLERRDPWVLVGEELLRAAFWFHPAAWWLVARLGALRELSCDCLVVRRTGKRKRYASALVEYASWMQRPAAHATWAAVVPWSESRGHLTRRIEMLLQPQESPRTGRVLAPAAVGVLMTFLWSGQLALATSSCASTNAEHDHPHTHDEAGEHDVLLAHDSKAHETHEVRIVTHDGKKLVLDSKGEGGKPVLWRVHAEGQEGPKSEHHVVVIQKGDDDRVVYTGEDAKKWLAEHNAKGKANGIDGTHSKSKVIHEIEQAWDGSDGEHDVFVIRGDDGKAKGKAKVIQEIRESWSGSGGEHGVFVIRGDDGKAKAKGKGNVWFESSGQPEEEVEVIVTGAHGQHVERVKGKPSKGFFSHDVKSEDGKTHVRVLVHDGDGEEHVIELDGGGKSIDLDGKRFDLRFGDGDNSFFSEGKKQKLHEKMLELHDGKKAKLRYKVHGDGDQENEFDFTELHELGNVFTHKQKAGSELEDLRRELEKTRAALEKQRKMLEELKQQLEKQRAKVSSAKDWAR